MEAALFLIEGSLKAEVGLLHLVADADQILDRVLALVQAAVDQGGVGRPVGVVHDMLEDLVHLQGGAAFTGVQDGGVHAKGAGDLNAVDAGDGAGLLNGQDLGALLAGRDGGHESGAAAADDAHVHIIGLIRTGDSLDRAAEPGLGIAARLLDAVGNGFLHRAGGVGRAGNAVQAQSLVFHDGGDQLLLNLGEEDRGLVLGDNLNTFKGGFGKGALHGDIAQVAICGRLILAGLIRGIRECGGGHTQELGRGQAEAGSGGALQEFPTGDFLFCHGITSFLFILMVRASFVKTLTRLDFILSHLQYQCKRKHSFAIVFYIFPKA